MTSRREGLFIGAAMLGLVALPLVGLFAWMSVKLGEEFFLPAMLISGVVTAVVLRGPVGGALARRLEARVPDAAGVEQQQLELEDLRGRVQELEERLDFTERMLARPEAERIDRT